MKHLFLGISALFLHHLGKINCGYSLMVQKVTIVEYLWCKFLVISICNKINEIVNVKLPFFPFCLIHSFSFFVSYFLAGYVQASKRDKKFFACAPNYSYAALCECLRRVFIYRQPTPMSTVLYNRKEGRQVGQVAKQQVASLETNDPILGFQATNERLFVLTTKIFCFNSILSLHYT